MNTTESASAATAPRSRRRTFPVTPLRLERLQQGLRLYHVANRAGMSAARLFVIERVQGTATAEEINLLLDAIAALTSPEAGG